MRRALKWIGIVVGLVILTIIGVSYTAAARLNATYNVQVQAMAIPTDAASFARGRRLVYTGRCVECHGENLGGKVSLEDPSIGRIYASNLTSGRGGVGKHYSDADWVRAIRHGIGPAGRSLLITPAQFYYYLSDDDLGAIIAYIKSVPPVDNELPGPSIGLLAQIAFMLFNPPDWLPAEKINHTAARPAAPASGVTAAYGQYLLRASTCMVCHTSKDLSTAPAGALAGWSEADFMRTMRTGRTPKGDTMNNDEMPWRNIGRMTDDELRAIWLYLQTLPSAETHQR